jgi:anti-sigma B factor antagonist
MEQSVREVFGRVVVSFDGEIDLEHSPQARRTLLDSIRRASAGVVVDLEAVRFIDSSGIASLVEAYQSARQKGTRFGLAAVSPTVLRVLALSRLDKVFPIHATVEEGLQG